MTPYHAKYYAYELSRSGGEGVDRLGRALFDATVDLNPHQIEADVIGNLMAVDYETMRCELRSIDHCEIRSVRCQYGAEHEQIAKSHVKKRVQVHGRPDFDLNGHPRFIVVEKITPISEGHPAFAPTYFVRSCHIFRPYLPTHVRRHQETTPSPALEHRQHPTRQDGRG